MRQLERNLDGTDRIHRLMIARESTVARRSSSPLPWKPFHRDESAMPSTVAPENHGTDRSGPLHFAAGCEVTASSTWSPSLIPSGHEMTGGIFLFGEGADGGGVPVAIEIDGSRLLANTTGALPKRRGNTGTQRWKSTVRILLMVLLAKHRSPKRHPCGRTIRHRTDG